MSMLWECPECGAENITGWLGPEETPDCPECGAEMFMM